MEINVVIIMTKQFNLIWFFMCAVLSLLAEYIGVVKNLDYAVVSGGLSAVICIGLILKQLE